MNPKLSLHFAIRTRKLERRMKGNRAVILWAGTRSIRRRLSLSSTGQLKIEHWSNKTGPVLPDNTRLTKSVRSSTSVKSSPLFDPNPLDRNHRRQTSVCTRWNSFRSIRHLDSLFTPELPVDLMIIIFKLVS